MAKAGIPRTDRMGRRLDFHSLSYIFATNLARNGAAQRVRRELMCHSDPKLTAQLCSDVSQLPTREAIHDLPWLGDIPRPTNRATKFRRFRASAVLFRHGIPGR